MSSDEIDLGLLIDRALASAQIECGIPKSMAAIRAPALAPLSAMKEVRRSKPPRWTEEEDRFLRENMGYMTFSEIGKALGRSAIAVEIHHERAGIPRPLVDARFISANKIAQKLGVDPHKVCSWIDRGLLPGEYIASEFERRYRRVPKITFLRWLVNPANWLWFDPDRVMDPKLRGLLIKKKELWGDEWWNTRQAAEYHGVKVEDIKRYIQLGRIRAVQTMNRGARHRNPRWAHWYILRSEATRKDLVFEKGKGSGRDIGKWSETADAFYVLGRAIGVPIQSMSAMSGEMDHRIDYRLRRLIRKGKAQRLIEEHDLPVEYRDGILWSDWRYQQQRFPALARSMQKFARFIEGSWDYPEHYYRRGNNPTELCYVRSVLVSWARWSKIGKNIGYGSTITPLSLRKAYRLLRSLGIDPLEV